VAVFAYKGINASGKNVKGVKDADSARALKALLKRQGVMVTEVLERSEAEKKSAREIDLRKMLRRVSKIDIALATQQLAVLLRSGIPLVEALTALIDQLENPELKHAFTDARDKVNEGIAFAEALRAHPKYFSNLYVSMVGAGEASGTLEIVLQRLADFVDSQAKLEGQVRGALAYPVFMIFVAIGILVMMVTVVVPKVTAMFENFGKELPWYTSALITVSDILVSWWWLIGALLAGGVYFFRKWKKTPDGKKRWDLWMLRAPLFGNLSVKIAVSRFARTLATLLTSGVPILRAMDITKDVLGNTELMRGMETARDSVREGEGLAKPLKQSERFPPIVTHMIAIGERSGQLEEMLEHVAAAYDRQVEAQVQTMAGLLGPLVIVFMGVFAGGIAFSILMPLLQMNEFAG